MPPKRQAALRKGGADAAVPISNSDTDEHAQDTAGCQVATGSSAESEPSEAAGDSEQTQAEGQEEEEEEMIVLDSEYLLVEEAEEGDQIAQEGQDDKLTGEEDDDGIEAEAEGDDQESETVQGEDNLVAGATGEDGGREDVEGEQGDEDMERELRWVEEMWEKKQTEDEMQEGEEGAAVNETDNVGDESVEQVCAGDSSSKDDDMPSAEKKEGNDDSQTVATVSEAEKFLQTTMMLIKIPRVYNGPCFDRNFYQYCVRVLDVCFHDLQHLRLPLLLAFALTSRFIESAKNHIVLEIYTDDKNIKQLMKNLLLSTVFHRQEVRVEVDFHKADARSEGIQDENVPLSYTEHVTKASFLAKNSLARKAFIAPDVKDFHSATLSKDSDRMRSLFLHNLPSYITEEFLMVLFPCCLKAGIVKVSSDFRSAVLKMKDKKTAYNHLLAFTKFRIDGRDIQLSVVDISQEDALKKAKGNVSKTVKKEPQAWVVKGMSAAEAQRKELEKAFSSITDKVVAKEKEDKKRGDAGPAGIQGKDSKSVSDVDKPVDGKKPGNDGKREAPKEELERQEMERKAKEKQEREKREKERKEREQRDRQRREREQQEREKQRQVARSRGGRKRPPLKVRRKRDQQAEHMRHTEQPHFPAERDRAWQQQQQHESYMIDLERELLQQEQELRARQEREMEAQLQAQREMEMARERELAAQRERQRQMEMERLRVEQMHEMERQREMELQRELQAREEAAYKLRMMEEEHRRMQEREQEIERNNAKLRQQEEAERRERERLERERKELERQREREAQRMQQRQQEKERMQQRELEMRRNLDRQREMEAQRAMERQRQDSLMGQPLSKRSRFEDDDDDEDVSSLFEPNQQQRRSGNSPLLGDSRQGGRSDLGLLGEAPMVPGLGVQNYESLERKVAAQREELMRNLALLEKLNKNPSIVQEAPSIFEPKRGLPPKPATAVREEHSHLSKPLFPILPDRQRSLHEESFDQDMRIPLPQNFKGRMPTGPMQADYNKEPEERKVKDFGRPPLAPHVLVTKKSHSAEAWPPQRFQPGPSAERDRNLDLYPPEDFSRQPGLLGSRPLFEGDQAEHDRLLAVIAGDKKKEPPSATVTHSDKRQNLPDREFINSRFRWGKSGK